MTKFTTALAVALAAAFFPFGKGGACLDGEVGLGLWQISQIAAVFANDCVAFDTKVIDKKKADACGHYQWGSSVDCHDYEYFTDPAGQKFRYCYPTYPKASVTCLDAAANVANIDLCCSRTPRG